MKVKLEYLSLEAAETLTNTSWRMLVQLMADKNLPLFYRFDKIYFELQDEITEYFIQGYDQVPSTIRKKPDLEIINAIIASGENIPRQYYKDPHAHWLVDLLIENIGNNREKILGDQKEIQRILSGMIWLPNLGRSSNPLDSIGQNPQETIFSKVNTYLKSSDLEILSNGPKQDIRCPELSALLDKDYKYYCPELAILVETWLTFFFHKKESLKIKNLQSAKISKEQIQNWILHHFDKNDISPQSINFDKKKNQPKDVHGHFMRILGGNKRKLIEKLSDEYRNNGTSDLTNK